MKSQALQSELDSLLKDQGEARPVIVAYGMMNAGKSYLLNMLTGHLEQEFFKTNDIRETVDVARYGGAGCDWLDTPGLDADEEDDRRAQQGVRSGDIVLFVHQPQGELEAKELAFLGRLRASLDAQAARNIVVVLSKADKEAADKIGQVEQRVAQQCSDLLGFAPCIFRVSARRHRDGSIKGQQALVAAGGVEVLAAHLRELAADVHEVRAQKRLSRIDGLLAQVGEARAAALAERSRLRTATLAAFSAYSEGMAQLRRFLDASASDYKRIQG